MIFKEVFVGLLLPPEPGFLAWAGSDVPAWYIMTMYT